MNRCLVQMRSACLISRLDWWMLSPILGANGRMTTFLVTRGECLSMSERRSLLYCVTRQSRLSEGLVSRLRHLMSATKASGSMQRSRRNEICLDGKRDARQDTETSTERWSLKNPRTLVDRTSSSDDLEKTRSRVEPLSWVADATSCEKPKASKVSSSLRAASSGVSRMCRLKSLTIRIFSLEMAIVSRSEKNSSRKTRNEVLGGL